MNNVSITKTPPPPPTPPKSRKKVQRTIYLPKDIKLKVEALDIKRCDKDNIYKFLMILISKAKKEGDIYREVALAFNYLKRVLGAGTYKRIITHLEKLGIITCDYFKVMTLNKKGRCYRYKLVFKERYSREKGVAVSYSSTKASEALQTQVFQEWFEGDFKSLVMPMNELRAIAKRRKENVSLTNCKVGTEIRENVVEIVDIRTNFSYRASKEVAMGRANLHNRLLIQDKSACYIMTEGEYLRFKRSAVELSDSDALNKIESGNLRAARNTTNQRLDTNFTNLPNEFMAEICKANNLKTLDIVNSQIALMSRVMPDLNTADSELFKSISVDGTFYESVQQLLGLKSRKEAKIVSFEMLFSARGNRSVYLKRMREVFPSVMAWVDGYKLEHGDNMFAVMLQREESKIFVDGLLRRIKVLGYLCFTKHDSIIYRAGDAGEIERIAEGYFAEIGFKCKYKIEDYL